MNERFTHPTYRIHKKLLQLFGATLWVNNPAGNLALYAKMKAFKLKDDIRLYTGEDMQTEILTIKGRQIIDFAAAFDVFDSTTGETVGALKRRGFKSMFKDEWIIMDNQDRELGRLREDNTFLALLRRFITNLIPQSYHVEIGGTRVATFKQNFNPFVTKLDLNFTLDTQGILDRRLGMAAGILLCVIEGKQR